MNRLIQWFVENPVAANLLMALILIGGYLSAGQLNREVFPAVSTNLIEVSMTYPGAGPSEIEQLITVRIEEAIADLDGIYELTSSSRQGRASVTAEVSEGHDAQQLLNDIKARVDAINTFPADAERPITRRHIGRSQLMSLALYGELSETALKETGQQVRDQLALLPGISQVELNGTRPYEVSVELSEAQLRRHQLSFEQVAQAIAGSSINLPAGAIRTRDGDIQIQTRNQADTAADFERITLLHRPDGSHLRLGDVARVRDGFAEDEVVARFNGQPAVFLELSVTENPDVMASAELVRDYLQRSGQLLPAGLELAIWRDMSTLFESRLNLLMSNALTGLLLVFVVLMLFLRPLLAIWVCVGIATAFTGAVWLLPWTGVSVNMISLFAFLLVLGIVVDDAIIVGESIYSRQQQGLKGNASAASGAKLVSVPVFFAVLSSILFFVPMLMIPGTMGVIAYAIPVVVILCLVFSLIECLLILPSHLAHMRPERAARTTALRALERTRRFFAGGLTRFADRLYRPVLAKLLRHRGATITGFVGVFALALTVYTSGYMQTGFMPRVPSDYVQARVELPEATPFHEVRRIQEKVERAARELRADDTLRERNRGDFIDATQSWAQGTTVRATVALEDAETRRVSSPAVSRRWRELIGDIPEAREYRVDFTINVVAEDIALNLSIADEDVTRQREAADRVRRALSGYGPVSEIRDSLEAERAEIEVSLRPHAESLGITLAQVARQVRQAFHGEEVQRIPRGSEDVRVLVRYPESDRRSLDQLDRMRVRTAEGTELPLTEVARLEFVPGYTVIDRRDRQRDIRITASVDAGADSNAIVRDLLAENLARFERDFPGFTLEPAGEMRDQMEFMDAIYANFLLALVVIYGLMAVNFRSYWQPLLILTAIPFGFVGAVAGHLIMGREVSMLSMLGFVACAGVVINDNLVLVDRINRLRRQGRAAIQAVLQAGRDRFRAIVLTSLTTFIGLLPIMLEQSVQARFLIPMVISLAYGVLFASVVTLILVPCLYMTGESAARRWHRWRGNERGAH